MLLAEKKPDRTCASERPNVPIAFGCVAQSVLITFHLPLFVVAQETSIPSQASACARMASRQKLLPAASQGAALGC